MVADVVVEARDLKPAVTVTHAGAPGGAMRRLVRLSMGMRAGAGHPGQCHVGASPPDLAKGLARTSRSIVSAAGAPGCAHMSIYGRASAGMSHATASVCSPDQSLRLG